MAAKRFFAWSYHAGIVTANLYVRQMGPSVFFAWSYHTGIVPANLFAGAIPV